MKRLLIYTFIVVTVSLAWVAWHPPALEKYPTRISMPVPSTQTIDTRAGGWVVMTRRMISRRAVAGMKKRLIEAGFQPELIQKREPVELHAFDDPRIFKQQAEAAKVKAEWRAMGIEADVLHHLSKDDEKVFKVGLGRFFMSEYAESMQKQLKLSKRAYNYERRTVSIPSYHFIFSNMPKNKAEKLWTRLQNMGIADPVLMQQSEFERLYPNKSAKRSNK